ncbi:MAG: hypothetical protein KVP17_004438 [Porospora cf. gigantea B]|uniref:uncharacterized protein n=1 Tax=Porospora cf. gigantea B TaxID=2853592 RepID=UPI003571810E|nr:MAG: hypothetical protein KVP17_004438 [Porospora cf. gigantea B]
MLSLFVIPITVGLASVQWSQQHSYPPTEWEEPNGSHLDSSWFHGDSFLASSSRLYPSQRDVWCPRCPFGNACYHLNRVINGPNIRVIRRNSPYECAKACREVRGCGAISYKVFSGQCHLKSRLEDVSSRDGVVSASVACVLADGANANSGCLEHNTMYFGSPIAVLRADDPDECASHCKYNDRCRYFSLVESRRTCTLMSSRNLATYAADVVSGSRHCSSVTTRWPYPTGSPTSTPSQRSCISDNTVFNGSVLKKGRANDVYDCAVKCRHLSGCKKFSYNTNNDSCLMLSNGQKQSRHGRKSGSLKCLFGSKCFEQRTDFTGNDIDSTSAASVEACAAECENRRRCQFFTYDKSGQCYLKTSDAGRRSRRGATSGSTNCLFDGKCKERLLPGVQLRSDDGSKASADTVLECAQACNASRSCKAFTFRLERGACFLKKSVNRNGVKQNSDAVSGFSCK